MGSIISFSSLKGGVGKSSTTIQTANYLAKSGLQVLVVDMDLNNSVTTYYITENDIETIEKKNIASAMFSHDSNLHDYTIKTQKENIDLIASSLYLIDMRNVSERRLSKIIQSVKNDYDVILLDTQPTFDNIVLNSYFASDIIITPVHLSMFDFNTAKFLQDKMETDVGKLDSWFLHINGYNHNYQDAKSGNQVEYQNLFINNFSNLTDISTWFPWSTTMRSSIDRNMEIASKKGVPNSIHNKELFKSIKNFAGCLVKENVILPEIDSF